MRWTTLEEKEFRDLFREIVSWLKEENEVLDEDRIHKIVEERLRQKNRGFTEFLKDAIFFWNIVKSLGVTRLLKNHYLKKYPDRKYVLLVKGDGLHYHELGRQLTPKERWFEEKHNKSTINYLRNMPKRDIISITEKFGVNPSEVVTLDMIVQDYLDRDTPKLVKIGKKF